MRNVTTAVVLLLLVGCSDRFGEAYSTYAEAQRAGAIERGWIPAFVPHTARDITDSHDLDTNRQTLEFTVAPSDIEPMVAGFSPVSAADRAAASEIFRDHGLGRASETYLVCSGRLNGALAVDRKSGRVVYDTTVDWADNDCSRGE